MNTKIKYFALLTVCLFFMAIFTSACDGGKNNPPTNDNKDKEEIPEGADGYPHWGAVCYNDTYNPKYVI